MYSNCITWTADEEEEALVDITPGSRGVYIRAYLRCRNMQFWRTTCKYRRVIGQQYTRGIQSLISRCQRPRYSEFFDGIPWRRRVNYR